MSLEERRNFIFEIRKGGSNLGTWMHEILALKLSAWLDADFEFWIFNHILEITFGNYKKHWDANLKQEKSRLEMEYLENKILTNPNLEDIKA